LHILRVTADQELPPERDAPISNLPPKDFD